MFFRIFSKIYSGMQKHPFLIAVIVALLGVALVYYSQPQITFVSAFNKFLGIGGSIFILGAINGTIGEMNSIITDLRGQIMFWKDRAESAEEELDDLRQE